jgi:co-chaperonin GroES (HSP10)
MAVPKTKKLREEEAAGEAAKTGGLSFDIAEKLLGTVPIRPVDCQNDFIAIMQSQIETTIELSNDDHSYKNEGLVIGVGPGVADGAGGRLAPTISIGDYVMFGARNVLQVLAPDDGPYKGKKVVIVSEKNILCRLPSDIQWEIVEEE